MDADEAPIERALRQHGYEPLPPFVILDEHVHLRTDNGQPEVFDRPRLERLAAKLNGKARYQNTPMPVVVGHTTPGVPEERQPGIRGWCTRYQVGDFYDETGQKKAGIYAVPWAAPGEKETFKKFPHRSIELWTGGEHGDDIHPLALLGPTAPRRNLGVHLFSRDHTPGRYHYSRGVDMGNDFSYLSGVGAGQQQPPASGSTAGTTVGNMTIDQLAASLAPALSKTQEFSSLFGLRDEVAQLLDNEAQEWEPGGMDQGMGGQMGMDPSMMGGGMGGQMDPAMAGAGMGGGGGYGQPYPQQFSRLPYNPYQQGYAPYGPTPQQLAAQQFAAQQQARARGRQPQRFSREHLYQHAPSAVPGLPTQYTPPPGSRLETVPVPELPAGDPYKAHFDRLTALLAPLVEKVQAQERAATAGTAIDRDLTTLAAQHRVKFDFARERKYLLDLPTDEARKEHFQRMVDNYARLGVGELPPVAAAFPVPGHQQVSTPLPAPQYGHQLTVGTMLPSQSGAPIHFSRAGAGGLSAERPYDEAALPQVDAFTLAAQARQAKMDVPTFLQHLRQSGAGQAAPQNGQVEKVR